MKIEVHTLRFGSADWIDRCAPTLDAWCSKHGLSLNIWTDETSKKNGYPDVKFCEIDMLRAFVDGGSDQMIYVDADVYVNPLAPPPSFPKGMHIRSHTKAIGETYWMPWIREHFGSIEDDWTYSNAGVWIIDRESAKILLDSISKPYIAGIMEQNHFNYWIHQAKKSGLVVHDLSAKWNLYPQDAGSAWFYHIYGKNKDRVFKNLERSGKIAPTKIAPVKSKNIIGATNHKRPSRERSAIPNSKVNWPMFMDDLHISMLRNLLSEHKPKTAMEIGSHEGVSTQAFLDAIDSGDIGHLHIVEPTVTPKLASKVARYVESGKITMHTKSSWEILIPCDFVFIDGHHGWPAYADVASAIALGTKVIAMHDTNCLEIGIKECHGSVGGFNILKHAKDRVWHEDKEERPGMFTHRGFGWSIAK